MTVTAGDWVAFMLDGGIVYACVVYVRRQDSYPHTTQAFTTLGRINVDDVLEVRKPCP
jgi:hypothetical protein